MQMLVAETNWMHFWDSAVMCMFLPYNAQQMVDLTNAVTGWDGDVKEYLRIGERAATLARIYNLREGWTAAGDTLPKRFFKSFESGPLAGQEYPEGRFATATREYYRLMGWDEHGVPTHEKLKALGIEWARTSM
jgi:aldehyde:ferredoxin oxidoreductase